MTSAAHAPGTATAGRGTPGIRTLTDSDLADWLRALHVGFLLSPAVSEEELANRRAVVDPARTRGAFDGGRCVATFRSFAQDVSVPGGGRVTSSAVTNVTVSPTHRRRGLLSRMMAEELAEARERGDVLSSLTAAEYPIYGRYGFGPAAWTAVWTLDVRRAGLDPRWSGPDDGGRIDLVTPQDVRKLGPELFERTRTVRHGMVSRSPSWWDAATGAAPPDPVHPWTEPFFAVYRSAAGEVDGLLAYTADDRWDDAKQPVNTATVRDLVAATPAAERALWRFLCSVDWVTLVRTGLRAPDDLLPLLLPDPRAARITTQADLLWLRVLDVAAALEARSYAGEGALVLQVHDDSGLSGGRFVLETSARAASCAPTTASADLTLDVRELGALYLGDESAVRLAALGRVEETAPGAAARADALLRTARRPWCQDVF
ncbi:GNAT family N-acetyltransferase [Streptomyces sp. ODS05-4]|uniref:GNAT family N-acetyltransferase n=1 Tax=Streptomyces sp. ODS05-4 TaxID=2944939 RepID=UPI00210D0CCE|nr:GNAT family N-acetyltransferase [Streptomyces sp. ODS05-4]